MLTILLFFNIIFSYYLSNCLGYLQLEQTILINKLIQNKKLTPIMRQRIDKIIFNNYTNKTRSDAYIFYKKNYKLLKNVKKNTLNLYAQTGLIKSIKKFNGKSNFYNYSTIYIKSEMLKCISDHQFNILPHHIQTSRKISKYIKSKYNIMKFGSTNSEDEWKLDNINVLAYNKNYDSENNNQLFNIIQKILNNLDPKIKRTFNYRYSYDIKIIRSIIHVSELMCWSNEQTRLILSEVFNKIKFELKNNQEFIN